ncbi:MAG TPA: DnaJ domain-containing protein [Thermodesulfobacteriota bacterium]|nr:DnaJ domain-containing protein [Thermodesulfobacteriota bacterium]
MTYREDYYQTLGADRNATPQQIKEAYRKLAFQFHPDKNRGNPAALERMKEINEAYAVISDPRKRENYDAMSREYGPFAYDRFRQNYSDQDIFRGSDINQIFEEMSRAFGLRGFEEVFEESYGQGYRTFEFRRPGVFARGFVFYGPGFRRVQKREVQPEAKTIPVSHPGIMGKLAHYLLKKLLGLEEAKRGRDLSETILLDHSLAKEGGKFKYFQERKSKELLITIRPGIREGQKIRLKGMGEEGKNGGERGDLYLKVLLKKPFLYRVKDLLRL